MSEFKENFLKSLGREVKSSISLAGIFGVLGGICIGFQAFGLAQFLTKVFFEGRAFTETLLPVIIFLLGLGGRAATNFLKERWGQKASLKIASSLRERIAQKIIALGPAWRVGDDAARISQLSLEHVDSLDVYFSKYLPHRMVLAALPLSFGIIVLSQNWMSGILLLMTFPLIPLFMILVGKGAAKEQSKQMDALHAISGQFLDFTRGSLALRAANAEERIRGRFALGLEHFRLRTMKVLRLAFLSSTMLEFFTVLSIALIALQLGFNLLGFLELGNWTVDLDLSTAFFILLLAPEFFLPLRELGAFYHARAEASEASRRIEEFLNIESKMQKSDGQAQLGSKPQIELRNLNFAYDENSQIFRNLNLSIGAGELIAIQGLSGGGKTTLFKLLLGEIEASPHSIFINQKPLHEYDMKAYRDAIAWMDQHPRLLNASLRENLLIATNAPDEDLVSALEWAGLWPWFEDLPRGLDEELGDGGRQMSGGQLRRLALARIKLKNAGFILLDEPIASLDRESRNLVITRIAELKTHATVIVLTHHIETSRIAERTLILRDGVVYDS